MLKRLAESMEKFPGKKYVVWKGDQFLYTDQRSKHRVPYLEYKDPSGEFVAAIYLNHLSPCLSSMLIEKYFSFDKRVKTMCKFVLYWAKTKNLLGANRGFFSSYALVLMVIFFLQIIYPSIEHIY